MSLKDSLLNKSMKYSSPFDHWELNKPMSEDMVKELSNVSISESPRSFDGTRAADGGGNGIDGKLRVFLESDNAALLPQGIELINDLRSKEVVDLIENNIQKKVSNSFIRIEYIADREGFWLKPHKDIEEKLMTMMLFINEHNETEALGTDFYNNDISLVKTIPYKHNTGYYFASGGNTWHGLEKKEIKIERRCMQINYVTFPTSWPVKI